MMEERKENREETKMDMMSLLLRPELPNVLKELPTARFKVTRLSQILGTDAVFTLRGLPYGKVQKLRQSGDPDVQIQILLQGCVDPDLKDPALKERFGGATPVETVKRMLLAGEIEDLSREVERLCGFRRSTIEEVKNG